MIRTQIQLTEEQSEAVRRLASRLKVSQSEVVRRGIDELARLMAGSDSPDRVSRARAAAGRYASGRHDISKRHDDYLVEALKS